MNKIFKSTSFLAGFFLVFMPAWVLAADLTLFYPPLTEPQQAKAMAQALSQQSGLSIKPRIAKTYPDILNAFVGPEPVLVYVGSFVQALLYSRRLSIPILQAVNREAFYTSVLIVPKDAGDDPVAIVEAAGSAISYTLGASSGESGAKAASRGKAAIPVQSHAAAVNLVKIGKAKAAFVKNGWWNANQKRYPGLKQLDYPGVSDHRHPDYVLSANKAVSLEEIRKIQWASQKEVNVFGADSVVAFDPSLLDATLDLMKKGGINPDTYAW